MRRAESRKERLIDSLIRDPLRFDQKFSDLVAPANGLDFSDLRTAIRRIFDINENTLLAESNVNLTSLGGFNRRSNRRREKIFRKRIKRGLRLHQPNTLILAEGDSWFQFPVFITDVIDWLIKRKDYAIVSLAEAGDWLTNMIYDGKYVEQLSLLRPDIFLISGGGNDMVGSYRLASMVSKDLGVGQDGGQRKILNDRYPNHLHLRTGGKYLRKEFYAFILILKAQYWLLFRSIRSSTKFDKMRIITQGYANAIPSFSCSFDIRYPHKSFINWILKNGQWLKYPLFLAGIPDQDNESTDIHRKIVKTMIHELNAMFFELSQKFENVHHVDSRTEITRDDQWFDELHLKSSEFKKVAKNIEHLIDDWKGKQHTQ